jgi:cbb3-type cytochrome oxidase maturation protein
LVGETIELRSMDGLLYLIPIALFLGLLGLAGFLWAMRSGQFEDLDGAAERILFDEDDDEPRREEGSRSTERRGR